MSSRRISATPDGRFLQDASGRPFFWLADTAWTMCARLSRDEAERFFADRAAKGFTVIQTVAAGGPWYEVGTPNRAGEAAFVDSDPLQPNEAYWEHIDVLVACAESHGLRLALLPVWSLSDVAQRGIVREENAEAYGAWIARRYADHGTLWILGGDLMPVRPLPVVGPDGVVGSPRVGEVPAVLHDYRPVFDALASGIRRGAGDDAFITYHPSAVCHGGSAEPRTSPYFGDRSWLTVNMLQTSHFRDPAAHFAVAGHGGVVVWSGTESHRLVSAEYRSLPTRPVIDGEPRYEDIPVDLVEDGSNGFWTAYDARNAAYHAVFAGAAGHTYGNHSIWQSYGTGEHDYELGQHCIPWEEAMTSPASRQMGYLRDLVLSRPYFSRIPDDGILAGPDLPGDDHVSATRDRDGSWAAVYLPRGGSVVVDLLKITGIAARAWWFDPRTGEADVIAEDLPTTGERRFVAPTTGPAEDWILVVDDAARGYPRPGRGG